MLTGVKFKSRFLYYIELEIIALSAILKFNNKDIILATYKTKVFDKWALNKKNNLTDAVLQTAVEEMENDLYEANLGGDVYKKRVALHNKGKRGGARTLVAFKKGDNTFFMYGFAKSQQANIKSDELKALKLLAKQLLGYSQQDLKKAVNAGELIEVNDDE